MTPAGIILRAVAALLLGVFAFLALGYTFTAMGIRDTLRGPEPLLEALEKHRAYERVYDDGVISQQFEGALRGLVGEYVLDPETEAWLFKEILPPSELKTATEENVVSIIAFLNGETDTFEVAIDLAEAIPRIKPAAFQLVDERIDKAAVAPVSSDAELRASINDLTNNIETGMIPDSVPSLDNFPPEAVVGALVQSTESIEDAGVRSAVRSNLERDEQAILDALAENDSREVLKLAARAIADPVIDNSIEDLREDLDENLRFSAVDKIAQSVGSRQETFERFRFARTVLRLLTGAVSVLAVLIFLAAIAGIAGVFYPYSKHMVRWPGIALVTCGVTFLVVGLLISSFVGVWESVWCPFVEVPSCSLTIDIASELLSDAANSMTVLSVLVATAGILAIVAARFVPDRQLGRKGTAAD